MSETNTVLVVGATGDLGGRAVDALLARGKHVRALVREETDPSRLAAKGVEIARGDMLDPASLERAMTGSNAVVTSAAGYISSIFRSSDARHRLRLEGISCW